MQSVSDWIQCILFKHIVLWLDLQFQVSKIAISIHKMFNESSTFVCVQDLVYSSRVFWKSLHFQVPTPCVRQSKVILEVVSSQGSHVSLLVPIRFFEQFNDMPE